MMWGVFERQKVDVTVHVCLATKDGLIAPGHRFDECECHPTIDGIDAIQLIIHKGDN